MLLIAPLNHLLAQSHWASQRLRDHAGQVLELQGGPFQLRLQVSDSGFFQRAPAQLDSDVTITLPPDLPLRLLTDRPSIIKGTTLQGTANFTESLGFVFRHLRWDAEADLARFTGDILAYRLVRALATFFNWQQHALKNGAENLSEFLTEESAVLPLTRELPEFQEGVAALQRDLVQMEARLALLH